jgi:hypothetical protein
MGKNIHQQFRHMLNGGFSTAAMQNWFDNSKLAEGLIA